MPVIVSKKKLEADERVRAAELALRAAELACGKDRTRTNLMRRNLAARAVDRAYAHWCDLVLGQRPRVRKGVLQK